MNHRTRIDRSWLTPFLALGRAVAFALRASSSATVTTSRMPTVNSTTGPVAVTGASGYIGSHCVKK